MSQCYMWGKTEVEPKLSGENSVNNSNVGFHLLDANACKSDVLQRSGNYDTARTTEFNCSFEGFGYSRFHSTSKAAICSGSSVQNPCKRKRLYRWQRYKKHKKICCDDRSSIEWNERNNSGFNACAKVSDEVHSSQPTGDKNSLKMSSDVDYSQIKEPYGVDVLSSEMSPSSVFDIKSSHCPCGYYTSRCHPTCPLDGPSGFLHLNVSSSQIFNLPLPNSSYAFPSINIQFCTNDCFIQSSDILVFFI
jgi:hypothetical protein